MINGMLTQNLLPRWAVCFLEAAVENQPLWRIGVSDGDVPS